MSQLSFGIGGNPRLRMGIQQQLGQSGMIPMSGRRSRLGMGGGMGGMRGGIAGGAMGSLEGRLGGRLGGGLGSVVGGGG